MKRTLFLLALLTAGALPALAQDMSEVGIIVGGSRRFVDGAPHQNEDDFIESNFAFGNTSVELFWSIPIEPDLSLKFKGGRLDTQVAIPYEVATPTDENPDAVTINRRDVEGEVNHIEALVEYEFDEPFGSSGLFAGLGYYRQSASGEESRSTWGVTAGVNADFPVTRRYGVLLEAAYHWTRDEFDPRFLTVGAGLRISF
ncbi:MAG TPA: outer membrane beta-barrel protein [Thermoanaerobaculia bacterium]